MEGSAASSLARHLEGLAKDERSIARRFALLRDEPNVD